MEKKLKFTDKNGNMIIKNYNSWRSIVKGFLIKYAYKTDKEEEILIKAYYKEANNYNQTLCMVHEEYHWAMLDACGETHYLPKNEVVYPQKPGDYFDRYDSYIKENNLKEPFIFNYRGEHSLIFWRTPGFFTKFEE